MCAYRSIHHRARSAATRLSLREYQQRAPASRAEWKIVPVAPRVFPAALKDPDAPRERRPASSRATWVWSGAVLRALAAIAWMIARCRSRSRSRPSPS